MKIIDRTTLSLCEFYDLAPGEIFKSKDDFIYMKTDRLFSDPDDDAEEYNAILLSSGALAYFGFGEPVYKVEATLTVQPLSC